MVYCMDVTVDSADELPEGICRGARLSSVDFGPDLPKLCQTTSVHLGKSEEVRLNINMWREWLEPLQSP